MRPIQSKFKIYEENTTQHQYWANYAHENVLLTSHPHTKNYQDITDAVMDYVSTAAPSLAGKRTPLQDFLQGTGRVKYVDSDYVQWKLKGTGEVQAIQKENLHPGVECPGILGSEFQIKLDVEWFVEGDRLAPDVAKECQVIVQGGEPISDGTGFIYNVVLVQDDPQAFFPTKLLSPGIKWLRIGSFYGEKSRDYGSVNFGGMAYIEFRSHLSDFGKTFEVTNKAHQLNLKVTSCDANGAPMKNYPDKIISYIEAEFLAQVKWEKELSLFYGRSSGKQIVDSSSGYYRRIGPGLLEFLEDGNIVEYNTENFSIHQLTRWLQSIWFDRVAIGDRAVTIYTGQGGLQMIQEAIQREFAASSIESDFNTFVGKGAKTYGKGYTGLVYQTAYFTEIQMFPFGRVRFEHWPILDSTYLNGSIVHPKSGLPLSSYELIILNYGLGNGSGSNIEILKRRDSEVFTYECGTWSPAGPIDGRTGRSGFTCSGPQRSYNLYHTCQFGLRVKDVSLTAWFRPNITW